MIVWDDYDSKDDDYGILAKTLAIYGPKRVQMAPQFTASTVTLPKKVMDILGLTKEWLETEEAQQVFLGHQYNYDAVDEF
ncbi:hypothetical protein BU25DRAFT_456825 [Macroventuria anomochaeta]|uniref:Uncharacterized protein n=1 Tax=Macroventuria anomochaeta TaxID=301207 RepID=A0ACB6S8U8_9PLEO|nr:uncharacterized protein BU25DRAFT_456825 [Macroventuria anomochaeta]KAF2629768.1 hypothetical protein BU25DRAFT_456825 [Macroventuria anomochaeta]